MTLLVVGRTVEQHFITAINDYIQRTRRYLSFDMEVIPELKNTKSLSADVQKEKEGELILKAIQPGDVVGAKAVNDDNEIMMITTEGIIIQLRVQDISTLSRITSGVKLINLDNGVKVAQIAKVREKLSNGDEGQFYKGTLKNREVIETENSIVVLGDVYPGSAVISAGNIIILGGLYGEAYAGGSGREDCYIVALEMEPERLKIGDFKYKTNAKQSKWGIRPKVQPKIAHLKNGKIVFDPLTKELLGTF